MTLIIIIPQVRSRHALLALRNQTFLCDDVPLSAAEGVAPLVDRYAIKVALNRRESGKLFISYVTPSYIIFGP